MGLERKFYQRIGDSRLLLLINCDMSQISHLYTIYFYILTLRINVFNRTNIYNFVFFFLLITNFKLYIYKVQTQFELYLDMIRTKYGYYTRKLQI